MVRILMCIVFSLTVITTMVHASGKMVCVSEEDGSLYKEQKVRLDPPIEYKGKQVKFLHIRSYLSVAVTPSGNEIRKNNQGVGIYFNDHGGKNTLAKIDGTSDPLSAIAQVEALTGYDTDCIKDYSAQLELKLSQFNVGAAMGGFPTFKVVPYFPGANK